MLGEYSATSLYSPLAYYIFYAIFIIGALKQLVILPPVLKYTFISANVVSSAIAQACNLKIFTNY